MVTKKILGWIGLILILMTPFFILLFNRITAGSERYTIGFVVDIKAARAGYQPVYEYYVDGKMIKKRGSSNPLINSMQNGYKHLGKRYYVGFGEQRPQIGDIYLDYPVPDSIKIAPPNGWDSIPGVGRLEDPIFSTGPAPPVKKK